MYLLSCLEENINYMYAVHKCMLFEDFLMNQYETRSNIGNNIDEEEKRSEEHTSELQSPS